MKKILFILLVNVRLASAQCLTPSMVINTGYDPVSGTAINYELYYGDTPVPDPEWIVSYISPAADSAIGQMGLTAVIPGNAADIIAPSVDWSVRSNSNWITCYNGTQYNDTGSQPYSMILSRPFKLCNEDSLLISVNFAVDNYISAANIDDSIPLPSFVQNPTDTASMYDQFQQFTARVKLKNGNHRLNFRVENYWSNTALNPTGFDLYGTISSTAGNATLYNESDTTCNNFICAPQLVPTVLSLGNIQLSPNPAFGNVNIKGIERTSAYVIKNLSGAVVASGTITQTIDVIDVSQLPDGVYEITFSAINSMSGIQSATIIPCIKKLVIIH